MTLTPHKTRAQRQRDMHYYVHLSNTTNEMCDINIHNTIMYSRIQVLGKLCQPQELTRTQIVVSSCIYLTTPQIWGLNVYTQHAHMKFLDF